MIPEAHNEILEVRLDEQVEPAQQNEPVATEAMDVPSNPHNTGGDLDPPSPAPASSPAKMTEDIPSQKNDDVLINGEAHKIPEASNVLAKLVTKDEAHLSEKGQSKLELPNFDDFSTDELHVGYLSRLSTSWDMEASMVNMMKRKYEV